MGRFGRDLTLRAGGEYRDRKDKSDEYAVVGKQRGKSDRTRSKADLAADYRLSRSVKLTTGYQYKADQREQADRQDTDEHTLFLKGRYRPAGALQLGASSPGAPATARTGATTAPVATAARPCASSIWRTGTGSNSGGISAISSARGWMPASKDGGPG